MCRTGAGSEYIKIEETMSSLALQAISDWILAKTSPGRTSAPEDGSCCLGGMK